MEKITIGQKLWANPEGPNSFRTGDTQPIEVEVETIGKKYLTVKRVDGAWKFNKTRFYIETLVEDGGNYSPEWKLYRSIQEIEDKKERGRILRWLEKANTFRKLSLGQLRRIKEIVDEPNSNS